MKIKSKKEKVIPVDENGNPVEAEKKFDVKDITKKILYGLACAGCGILAFCAVGAAMMSSGSSGDEESDSDSEGSESDGSGSEAES